MTKFLEHNNADYRFVEVSTFNSASTPPDIMTPFIGKFDRITHHSVFTVLLQRAPLTSTGTLILEQSINGTDVHYTESIPVINGNPLRPLKFDIYAEWVRVKYLPADNLLTTFNLLTRYHTYQVGNSSGFPDATPLDNGGPYIGSVLAYTSITGVLDNILTTITSYTASEDTAISLIAMSGTTNSQVQLHLNGSPILVKRGGYNIDVSLLPGFLLNAGDILEVKVLHYIIGETGDFNASIFGGS